MQIDLGKLVQEYRTAEQQLGAEVMKAFGLSGSGFDNFAMMDIFGAPGHSAIGTSAMRDIEQVRGWNFTAILAKALQFGLGSMAVYCPQWIAEAICEQHGIEYKASKRVTGTEQYGVPEDWVTAPAQHRIAALLKSPNPWRDEATFLFEIAEQTNIHGVAHILVLPNAAGMPKELWVIPKAAIQPVAPSAMFPEGSYRIGHLSKLSINTHADEQPLSLQQALARISNREYSAKYIIPIGLPSPLFVDDFLNSSSAISDTVDTDAVIHRTRRNMLEKLMTTGPRLEPMPGVTVSNAEWVKLIEEFESQNLGPNNQGNAWRPPSGIKVTNDSHTGREMEFVQSADQSRDHTLGQHLLSSAMLGLGAGGSYAQVVGLIKGNARLILQPLMRIYSGQLTIGLRRFMDSPQNQFMALLQAANIDDPEQRRSEWDLLMKAKAVRVKEVREAFNMMPLGTDEDEKMAGEDPAAGMGGYDGYGSESDPGYAPEYAQTNSGQPETPGIGAPEAPAESTESLKNTGGTEAPSLGKMSRREFMRHSKNISDIVEKFRDGKFGEKTAHLMLQTLGLSKDMAQEFVDSVKDPRAEQSMSHSENQTTASALFSRAVQIKSGAFTSKSLIDDQARTAATHPDNMLRIPCEKDLKAGIYRKGRLKLCGLMIEIENPAGSVRSGRRPDGTRWAVEMQDHYGYIVGAVGFDKDQLDVFIKTGTEPDFNGMIFVINQANADGSFDEHKCFMGCASKSEAIKRYLDNYDDDWSDRIISVAPLPVARFKEWLIDPDGGPMAGPLHPQDALKYMTLSTEPGPAGSVFERALSLKAVDPRRMKDGDGDGVIFDGTPQERPAPQYDDQARRVMFEAAPDPNDVMLTSRWRNLSDEDRLRISRTLVDAIMPDVAQRIGAEISVSEQLGGYLDDTNPSFAAMFEGQVEPWKFIRTMKAAGFALSQDSMMGISTSPITGGESVGFVTVKMNNDQGVHDLYMKIRSLDDSVQGHTTIGNEMLIVDFTGRAQQIAQTIQDSLGVQATHSSGYAVFVSKDQYGYEQSAESEATTRHTSQARVAELDEKRWGHRLRGKASSIINRELEAVEARDSRLLKALTPAGGFFRSFSPMRIDEAVDAGEDDDEDPQEKAELIADILVSLYGDETEALLADGEDFEKLAGAFAKASAEAFGDGGMFKEASTRRRTRRAAHGADPRDGDGDGVIFDGTSREQPAGARPERRGGRRPKNSPEQIAQIHADVQSALKGERSAKSAKQLAESLSTLTVKQLRDIKLKYELKASGRTKQELVDKIAKRLDAGRRADQSPSTIVERQNSAAQSSRQAYLTNPGAERNSDLQGLRDRRAAIRESAEANAAVAQDLRTIGQTQAADRHQQMADQLRESAGHIDAAKEGIINSQNRFEADARAEAERHAAEVRERSIRQRAAQNQAAQRTSQAEEASRRVNAVSPSDDQLMMETALEAANLHRQAADEHQALGNTAQAARHTRDASNAQFLSDDARQRRENTIRREAQQRESASVEARAESQILEAMRQNPAATHTMRDLATLTQLEPGRSDAPLNSPLNRALVNMVRDGRIVAQDRQFGGPLFSLGRQTETAPAAPAPPAATAATTPDNSIQQRLAALKQNLPAKFVIANNEDGKTLLVSPNDRTRVLPDDPEGQVAEIEAQLSRRGFNPDDVAAGVRKRAVAAAKAKPAAAPAQPQQRGPLTAEQRTALKGIGADFLDDIEPDADGNLIQAIPSKASVVVSMPESWWELSSQMHSKVRESYSKDVRKSLRESATWKAEVRERAKRIIEHELNSMSSRQIAEEMLPQLRTKPGFESVTASDIATMVDTGEEVTTQEKAKWRRDAAKTRLRAKISASSEWMQQQYASAVEEKLRTVQSNEFYQYAKDKAFITLDDANQKTSRLLRQFGMTHQDLASVIGARDDWTVTVIPTDDDNGSLNIRVHNGTARMNRQIYKEDGKMHLYNSSFFLDNAAPKGLGLQVFSQSIANAKRLGFAQVKTMPCRSETMVGYAVWPQFGYDADISSIGDREVRERTKAQFPNAQTIRDIYDTPGGQEWWWANGDSLNSAKFDLTSGSRNMVALQSYMKKKKSQRDRVRSSAQPQTA